MKSLISLAALLLCSSLSVQADLPRISLTTLAGWDFNGGISSTVSSVNARYSQSQGTGFNTYFTAGVSTNPGNSTYGTVYFTGSNGGSFGSNRALATSNAPAYDLLSVDGLIASNNSLGDVSAANARSVLLSSMSTLDSGRAAFKLATVSDFNSFYDISVAFSARNGGTDFATISWSYSLDGVNFTSIANTSSQIVTSGIVYSVFSADLSAIHIIDGQSSLWLGMEYAENSAGASVFLDNVAIYGMTIPEPSTYSAILGALSLGVVMVHRRFQARAA